MENLPNDLIAEILSRLPAKPLIHLKCISKRWCSLISSPDFVKLQSQRSHARHMLIALSTRPSGTIECVDLNEHRVDSLTFLQGIHGSIVGSSCNGFLCLRFDMGWDDQFSLYNPVIQVVDALPSLDNGYELMIRGVDLSYHEGLGFGYDSWNDDYKVVRIIQRSIIQSDNQRKVFSQFVDVYSMKYNDWAVKRFHSSTEEDMKLKNQLYFCQPHNNNNNYLKNALHWPATKTFPDPSVGKPTFSTIACFDLSRKRFYELPLPDFTEQKGYNGNLELAVLREFLHLIVDNVYVWVMKRYYVKESWTKMYTLPNMDKPVRPIVYRNWGEEIIVFEKGEESEAKAWFSFDLRSQTTKDLGVLIDYKEAACYEPKTLLDLQPWFK